MRCAEGLQAIGHRLLREARGVALPGKMAQIQMPQIGAHDFPDGIGGRFVGEMPVPAHDSLLQAPGAMRTIAEHLDIMIGFQNQNVRPADAIDDQSRGMTQIREKTDVSGGSAQEVTDRVLGIVRNGKGFDHHIAQIETRAGFEQMAGKSFFRLPLQRVLGGAVAIDRNIQFFCEQRQALDMIGMFVRDKNPGQIFRRAPNGGEAFTNLSSAETSVDQDAALSGFDVSAITRGATA